MSTVLASFKLDCAQELKVSTFFQVTVLTDWNIENYYAYISASHPKKKLNSIIRMYMEDLEKLKKCAHLPKEITCTLEHLRILFSLFIQQNPSNNLIR